MCPAMLNSSFEQAHGMVLEVGPGSGEWLSLYDKHKVTRILGVELNKDHHDKLRRKIIESGLEDIYVICGVRVEDLGVNWVDRGEVDCVVTVSPEFDLLDYDWISYALMFMGTLLQYWNSVLN